MLKQERGPKYVQAVSQQLNVEKVAEATARTSQERLKAPSLKITQSWDSEGTDHDCILTKVAMLEVANTV